MADITRLMAIDAAGPNSDGSYNVTVLNYRVSRVTVQEDYDSAAGATADLRAKSPAGAANFIKIAKGVPMVYTAAGKRFFDVGEVVGTIKTSSGSINAQIVESIKV